MTRYHAIPLAAVVVAVGAAGCGQSKEDKATSAICNARDDISKQVDQLAALTPTTVTRDGVQSSLKAIGGDLTTIRNSYGDLSGERKQQVQTANQAFAAELRTTAAAIGTSVSLSAAGDQVTQAFQQLADTYKTSFARIDCS